MWFHPARRGRKERKERKRIKVSDKILLYKINRIVSNHTFLHSQIYDQADPIKSQMTK